MLTGLQIDIYMPECVSNTLFTMQKGDRSTCRLVNHRMIWVDKCKIDKYVSLSSCQSHLDVDICKIDKYVNLSTCQ